MKICKLLIILLFLLSWSGGLEARSAFENFPRSQNGCLNQPFFTSTVDLVQLHPVDLHRYGWFAEGGTVPLFGEGDGTLILGQAGPTLAGDVHTLIFRSRNVSTNEMYEDVLRITVFGHPRIERPNRPPVCYGENVVLQVDSYENADVIRWIDQTTSQSYPEGHVLTVREARTFLVVATNPGCLGIQDAQLSVTINIIPPLDTNWMILREQNWAEICPGCTRRLGDFLAWENSDSLVIDHSTCTLNGNTIAPLNLNSSIGSPPEGRLVDIYVGTITGRLYRTNQCSTFTRTLINFPITLEVSRENCQFQVRWLGVAEARLLGGACVDHTIEIVNPRPHILNVEDVARDIVITSNKNFPISLQSTPFPGVYRFRYTPEDNDTLTITVTYRNICCSVPERFTITRTLFFETDERIDLDQRYCRTDSLHLIFSSNRMGTPSFLVINSIEILEPHAGLFFQTQSSEHVVTYTYYDTIHSWGNRLDNPRAVVHYTYCGVVKTDTLFIQPHLSPDYCHPTLFITSIECKGDTNFILITEHRRPRAYIVYINWDSLSPDIQLVGDLDTLTNYPPQGQTVQFRQRFITYTSAPIRFHIRYQEAELDTLVEMIVQQRILPNCSPTMMIERTTLCRGQETRLDIQLRNRNGRIVSIDSDLLIDWDVSQGEDSILLDRIDHAPVLPFDVRRTYHHLARFQKTNDLNVVITYSFGDSIREHAFTTQRINILDCRAEIWQEASNKTYCDGEVARFEIRPHLESENEIVRVVWDYIPISPMILDSTNNQTGIWHFYTHVYRDTTFVAFVQEVDFWGDIVYYILSDYVIVRPFPRIWRNRVIDVCETDTVDLNLFENGIPKFWNPEFITRINAAALPPFNNVNAYAWLSLGDSIRQFIVQGEARFQCASMGGTNTVTDTIYLHWNRPAAVSIEAFPLEGVCENYTLRLQVFGADVRSIITWLRDDEIIFYERNVTDILLHTVTESAYYTVISRTACGTVSAREFLTAIPAPPITLPPGISVCLNDFTLLSLPANPYIVGVPEWHVGDEVFVGNNFNVQVRDADNPTVVTVFARGYNDCNAKGTIEITPIALPNVEIGRDGDFSDTVSCESIGSAFALNVRGGPGVLDWEWIFPSSPTDFLDSDGISLNIPSATTPTTFRIKGEDPVTGCRNFANFHIVILENDINFTLDMAGNFVAEDKACIHANFVFEAEYIRYMTHIWRTLYGRDIHSRFLTIYNVVPADIGTYRLVRNLHSCRDTSWLDIDLMPFPNLQFPGLLPSYCVGDPVEFSIVTGPGVTYDWVEPFGTEIAPNHYKFANITEAYSRNFLLLTAYNNCWFHDTLRVQVYPLPIIDFTPYEFLCEGFDLTMNLYRPNATYLWCNNYTTPTRRITTGGEFTVTISENNCFYTASVFIEDRPTPRFRLPNDTTICWNDPRIFWADPTIPSDGRGVMVEAIGIDPTIFNAVEFAWRRDAQLVSQSDRFEIFYAGIYTLTTELHGCEWSESIRISNTFCDVFEMPNAFRPGSGVEVDGTFVNRTFGPARAFPEDLVVFEMFIYDGWGNRKFRTNDQNIRWDGRDMNGRELRPGVFIWVIRAHETISGQNLSDRGTVTLIR